MMPFWARRSRGLSFQFGTSRSSAVIQDGICDAFMERRIAPFPHQTERPVRLDFHGARTGPRTATRHDHVLLDPWPQRWGQGSDWSWRRTVQPRYRRGLLPPAHVPQHTCQDAGVPKGGLWSGRIRHRRQERSGGFGDFQRQPIWLGGRVLDPRPHTRLPLGHDIQTGCVWNDNHHTPPAHAAFGG